MIQLTVFHRVIIQQNQPDNKYHYQLLLPNFNPWPDLKKFWSGSERMRVVDESLTVVEEDLVVGLLA